MPQRGIRVQHAADQHLFGLDGADAHQDRGQLAPHVERHAIVVYPARELPNDDVAEPREGLGGIVVDLRPADRSDQRVDQRLVRIVADHGASGLDRLPHDIQVGVREQGRQHLLESRGNERDQPGGFGALAAALAASSVRHRRQNRARGIEILRGSWRGEERRHPRSYREVGEVSELLDLRERIDALLPREVQQRFCPHRQVGIPEERHGVCGDLPVAGSRQEGQCALPNVGL